MDGKLFEQEGYELMGAAFEVYNEMGNGYLEEVYQECLEQELETRHISFSPKTELTIHYKGRPLKKKYIPDLMVFGEIVVELKAVKQLAPEHEAQLLNYKKTTAKKVGYLINFGSANTLEWKRMIRTNKER
jgi:GxxExxY protein